MANKYDGLPANMMPQIQGQIEERIKVLEGTLEQQASILEDSLRPIREHLKEAKEDLKFVTNKQIESR